MANTKKRLFCIDGDVVEVVFTYDASTDCYFGDYPDFKLCPRVTPRGRRWVNVTAEDCPFADADYCDCGSCEHFRCECPGDLIGVCNNEYVNVSREEETL